MYSLQVSINYFKIFVFNIFNIYLKSGTIIYRGITAFPTNEKILSTYSIEFMPSAPFRYQATIMITFPAANYPVLTNPNNNCVLSGGLTTFASC
jgi:hypothetical protein